MSDSLYYNTIQFQWCGIYYKVNKCCVGIPDTKLIHFADFSSGKIAARLANQLLAGLKAVSH